MTFDAFIGPSYTAQSVNVDCERSVNLYAEAIEGGAAGKAAKVLYGTPGLVLFTTLPASPIRGMWANATRLFAVAGSTLYEIFADGSYNARGSVGNNGLPVQFFANGNQLVIVSNGRVYCDSGAGPVAVSFPARAGVVNTVNVGGVGWATYVSGDKFDQTFVGNSITIGGGTYSVTGLSNDHTALYLATTTPGTSGLAYTATYNVPASCGAFLDTFFIVAAPNSRQLNSSAINDGTTWAPADYALKVGYPDYIVALLADHEELWIFGTDTTEVWTNNAAPVGVPFGRIPGAFIHHGCAAAASPARLKNGVAWLSSDPQRGGTIAYLAQGFIPTRISTHAVETAWASYGDISNAKSFTYTDAGHENWVISFPAATWVYDATSGWWHERAWWNGSFLEAQRQAYHAFVFGAHYCGDRGNGKIYTQSLDALTDAGAQINRIRTAPHLSQEQLWAFYSRFQLDLELGQSSTTPAVTLEWSDDGGHTFHAPVTATPSGATYDARVVWRRLGKSRDRVFRVTITDPVKIALIKAYLDISTTGTV